MSSCPLSIAIVGPVYPFRGGIAHYTACLARALEQRGHQVEVINYRSLYPRLLFPGRTMLDESRERLSFSQCPILRPLAPWTWVMAAWRIRRLRPRVVAVQWWHVFFAPCLLTVILLCRLMRIPVAVICHNVSDHEKHALLSGIANRLLARLARSVVIQSAADAEAFQETWPRASVFVTQHPVYDVFLAEPLSREAARLRLDLVPGPLCLFFGLVRSYKGLQDLLQAMAILDAPGAPRLLIAGEFYEPLEQYEELVRKLGLETRVTIVDRYVPNEEIGLYFTAADVLIAPYRTASQSGVVRIATAFAVPAIVSDAGGLPEMIDPGRTGLVVPVGSPEKLAEEIQSFFSKNLAEQFRPYLEEQRTRYSWTPLAKHFEELAQERAAK